MKEAASRGGLLVCNECRFGNFADRTFEREQLTTWVAGRLDPSEPRLCATAGAGRAGNVVESGRNCLNLCHDTHERDDCNEGNPLWAERLSGTKHSRKLFHCALLEIRVLLDSN
jgi:hypothetical protein